MSTPTITFRASGWIVLWFVTGWPPRVLVRGRMGGQDCDGSTLQQAPMGSLPIRSDGLPWSIADGR